MRSYRNRGPFIRSTSLHLAIIFIFWSQTLRVSGSFLTHRYKCLENLSEHVKFYLYSRETPVPFELWTGDGSGLQGSGLNLDEDTKLVTHGFLEQPGYSTSTSHIIDALLKFTNVNIILVDWSDLSGRVLFDYGDVVHCVRTRIAPYVGQFIRFLVTQGGVAKERIHLVGFSVGAHLMGIAASSGQVKVSRITGLDPSGPYFESNQEQDIVSLEDKLDRGDAEVVDILHTNMNVLGTEGPDGSIDFYVNGGSFQPQCSNTVPAQCTEDADIGVVRETIEKLRAFQETKAPDISILFDMGTILWDSFQTQFGCDHHRAHQMFAASIDPTNQFPSVQCADVQQAQCAHAQCNGVTGYAGYYLNNTEPGIYYTGTDTYKFSNIETDLRSYIPGNDYVDVGRILLENWVQ